MSITLSTIAPILFLSTPERRLISGSRYYRALSVCRRSILVLSVTSNLLHRAAPRCARARLTRYHRHPCVSHYGSGCWPRGQPNKIYEPNTQRRTSAVSNWNCTAQLAQQRWWVGTGIDSNCHRCSNPKRLHTNPPTTVSNGRVPNRCTISTFTSSRRKGPTGIGASAGGGRAQPLVNHPIHLS